MIPRDYQRDFYLLYEKFKDKEDRKLKGEKIHYILSQYCRNLGDKLALDVGCSNGIITSSIRPLMKKVIGIDYDWIGLNNTDIDSRSDILYIHGDALSLPFANRLFGFILCVQVYEHVPDDTRLFEEIDRVISDDGIIFFSGPNKLFPIEPHYYLPFLHWLPNSIADKYLMLTQKGTHYYERSRTIGSLRKIFYKYDILDVSIPVIRFYAERKKSKILLRLIELVSRYFPILWHIILLFVPNFNWILLRRNRILHENKQIYRVIN